MTVENKYIDPLVAAGKLQKNALVSGDREIVMVNTFEVAAADSDGSVYRVFKGLDSSLIPIEIKIANDVITAGDDWDLGLYQTELGAVADKDVFVDKADLSSAHVSGSELSGLTNVDVANRTKTLYEHLGLTSATKKPRYDLCLTANTVGTAAGTVTVIARFVQG